MRLSDELQVYQYELAVTPDVMTDSYIIQNVLRTVKRKMESLLGLHVVSGRSVYTTSDLTESFLIITEFRGQKYEVLINAESKTFFSGKSLTKAKMEDHHMIFNLINIIIKQAFRETDLR